MEQTIISFITILMGLPVVGKVIIVILGAVPIASAALTFLVQLWHLLVVLLNAIKLPGAANALSVKLSPVDQEIEGQILPFLAQLSAIPLPTAPAPAAQPPAA